LESALSLVHGHQLGEVELDVSPEHRTVGMVVPPGKVVFHRVTGGADETSLELDLHESMHAGDTFVVKAPAGKWEVSFVNDAYRSRAPVRVDIRPRQLTPLHIQADKVDAPAAITTPPIATASAPQ
jgi:hypothetical protein